ncbi:hypothetical protein RRG08_001783 [Elysia crispata]|uniref:Uncharacterized protein n=1 Tax=Elysia crispata TaxID=231223 RepID=A0AAE1A964_9GAST|nr:hypothetical protein RRG08_001783 [Elysia crispata]
MVQVQPTTNLISWLQVSQKRNEKSKRSITYGHVFELWTAHRQADNQTKDDGLPKYHQAAAAKIQRFVLVRTESIILSKAVSSCLQLLETREAALDKLLAESRDTLSLF